MLIAFFPFLMANAPTIIATGIKIKETVSTMLKIPCQNAPLATSSVVCVRFCLEVFDFRGFNLETFSAGLAWISGIAI